MPLQLFTSLVKGSTPGDMVGGGFFESESPGLVLSAVDNALRSASPSPAPKTWDGTSMVSSRPSLGAAMRMANLFPGIKVQEPPRLDRVQVSGLHVPSVVAKA